MAKSKKSLKKLDETGKRKGGDRRKKKSKAEAKASRTIVERRVKRRRQIDPTTCEREYSEYEIEFMQAMDEYKRASGRMFPTCSEILEVLFSLGYRQIADPKAIYSPGAENKDSNPEEELDSSETEEIAN